MTIETGVFNDTSALLSGVPKIHFYDGGKRCPEDLCFPSCLRAVLEYLRDDFGCNQLPKTKRNLSHNCTYAYALGVSGTASMMGWENGAFVSVSGKPFETDGAPLEHAFFGIGYDYQFIQAKPGEDPKAVYREPIMESIRERKRPVIAIGFAGPPEASLITGYDQNGDVLIGWSFFQDFPEVVPDATRESNGCARLANAYPGLKAIILLGEKKNLPSHKEVYDHTLPFLLDLIRTPAGPEPWRCAVNGVEAYQSWADWLLTEEPFSPDNLAGLKSSFQLNDMMVGFLAEARWYGSVFLGHMGMNAFDNGKWSEEIFHAAGCYAGQHDLMWKMWNAVGGIGGGEEKVLNLAKPEVRRSMFEILMQAKAKEAEAAGWIERALAK